MVEGSALTPPIAETENKTERWKYDKDFKPYLYRVAILGSKEVEFIDNFPTRIELNDVWHTALNRMREESRDGRERWVPVGMKKDRKPDFMPKNLVEGHYTIADVLSKEEVEQEYRIIHHIGEIHSHPSDWFNSLGVNLIVAARLVKDFEGFSPPDLYAMVDGQRRPLVGLVEKTHNYFALRASETIDVSRDSHLLSNIAFGRHWARKYGGYYFGKSHLAFWSPPNFSLEKLNIGVAEAYEFALYKGKPGEDLVRQYP